MAVSLIVELEQLRPRYALLEVTAADGTLNTFVSGHPASVIRESVIRRSSETPKQYPSFRSVT